MTRLIAWVEGNEDEMFVTEIIKPIIIRKYGYKDVVTYKYANHTRIENTKFVDAFKSLNDDILCFTDIDNAPCIREKKRRIQLEKVGNVGDDSIIVVVKEIESWYLAGLDKKCCRKISIPFYDRTDRIGKQEFHALIAKSKYGRVLCMIEMIRNCDLGIAIDRNKSLNYFYRKRLQ